MWLSLCTLKGASPPSAGPQPALPYTVVTQWFPKLTDLPDLPEIIVSHVIEQSHSLILYLWVSLLIFCDVHGDLNTFARQSDVHLQKFHLYVFSLVEGDGLTPSQEKEAELRSGFTCN